MATTKTTYQKGSAAEILDGLRYPRGAESNTLLKLTHSQHLFSTAGDELAPEPRKSRTYVVLSASRSDAGEVTFDLQDAEERGIPHRLTVAEDKKLQFTRAESPEWATGFELVQEFRAQIEEWDKRGDLDQAIDDAFQNVEDAMGPEPDDLYSVDAVAWFGEIVGQIQAHLDDLPVSAERNDHPVTERQAADLVGRCHECSAPHVYNDSDGYGMIQGYACDTCDELRGQPLVRAYGPLQEDKWIIQVGTPPIQAPVQWHPMAAVKGTPVDAPMQAKDLAVRIAEALAAADHYRLAPTRDLRDSDS